MHEKVELLNSVVKSLFRTCVGLIAMGLHTKCEPRRGSHCPALFTTPVSNWT